MIIRHMKNQIVILGLIEYLLTFRNCMIYIFKKAYASLLFFVHNALDCRLTVMNLKNCKNLGPYSIVISFVGESIILCVTDTALECIVWHFLTYIILIFK